MCKCSPRPAESCQRVRVFRPLRTLPVYSSFVFCATCCWFSSLASQRGRGFQDGGNFTRADRTGFAVKGREDSGFGTGGSFVSATSLTHRPPRDAGAWDPVSRHLIGYSAPRSITRCNPSPGQKSNRGRSGLGWGPLGACPSASPPYQVGWFCDCRAFTPPRPKQLSGFPTTG